MGEEELDYETEHVLTVAGPVRPETLGPTLAAEHLVHSCADLHTPLPPAEVEEGAERRRLRLALAQARLTMDMLVDVRRHPFASLVNLRMDAEDASGELLRWTRCGESGGVSSGGGCAAAVLAPTSAVLEVTPRHRGRDVAAVSRLAAALPQLQVVLGTGCVAALVRLHFTPWCCAPAAATAARWLSCYAPDADARRPVQEVESTETELREYMLRELTVGSGEGGAGPRCGIIGEVVVGDGGTGPTGSCAGLDLAAADEKVLRAAAAAHAGTGAPVLVSVPRCGRSPALVPRLLQLLLGGGGVAPHRLLIAGLGFTCDEADVRAVLEAGCMLALALGSGASEVQTRPAPAAQGGQADGATASLPPPPPLCVAAGDAAVAALVTRICEAGHSSQVALCHSYLFKTQLASYGGEGLGLGPFLARLPARLDPASRRAMAGGNVARALAWWVRPRPPPPAPRASWRCCHCGATRQEGDDSFSRLGFRYCSILCLNAHRSVADAAAEDAGGDGGGRGHRGGGGGGADTACSLRT